jgi:hypothetical protein
MTSLKSDRADSHGRAVRLARLSGANRRLLVESLLMLIAASCAIRLLPFRRTAKLLGRSAHLTRAGGLLVDKAVAQCRWAVNAWADRVPWRAVCFQRGLALHLMLRRRGIPSILHYGVAQNADKGLHAHVWVDVNCQTVMGGEESLARFARLASFPATPQD